MVDFPLLFLFTGGYLFNSQNTQLTPTIQWCLHKRKPKARHVDGANQQLGTFQANRAANGPNLGIPWHHGIPALFNDHGWRWLLNKHPPIFQWGKYIYIYMYIYIYIFILGPHFSVLRKLLVYWSCCIPNFWSMEASGSGKRDGFGRILSPKNIGKDVCADEWLHYATWHLFAQNQKNPLKNI